METAIVTNIQGYSIHDGPGIRTVVFIKGCPLRCDWCANPETFSAAPETGFIANLCQSCGRCFKACKNKAIVSGDSYRIDRERCTTCLACVDACFYGALVCYGEEMTSQAVYEKTRRDKMFYDNSGGGVTFSGGEPLLKPKFIAEVSKKLCAEGIDTCVETCGAVPWSAFETVLPFTNRFYFDLKLMDAEKHRLHTGVSNEQILDNARKLVSNGANVLFRRPVIPGVNDGTEEVEAAARFLLETGSPRIELMPYHRMGLSKYAALSMNYGMQSVSVMDSDALEAMRRTYEKHGINCTISR